MASNKVASENFLGLLLRRQSSFHGDHADANVRGELGGVGLRGSGEGAAGDGARLLSAIGLLIALTVRSRKQ